MSAINFTDPLARRDDSKPEPNNPRPTTGVANWAKRSAGSPTAHFCRSPFPRSSDIVHQRAARPLGAADSGAGGVVIISRRAVISVCRAIWCCSRAGSRSM
jgi:hypothetical protein